MTSKRPISKSAIWNVFEIAPAIVLAGFVFSRADLSELRVLVQRVSVMWVLAGVLAFCAVKWFTAEFLQDAQRKFPSVPFLCASGGVLPFSDSSFDSIVAFEVIEHIEADLGFLHELRRVARQNAFIAISTPNRFASSGDAAKPLNPFHVREYSSTEFHALLGQVFSSVTLFGQHERTENLTSTPGLTDSLVDLVPIRWKYLLPAHIQDLFSVALRQPLQLEQCQFEAQELSNAHTLVALCRP